MKATWRVLTLTLAAMTSQAVVADTSVTVSATAPSRGQAIQQALGDALVDALGSHVFSVTTMTDGQLNSMSTAVTSGRVNSYDIIEEYKTYDGVHVRLSVNLTDQDLSSIAPKEITTWDQRIEDTQTLDVAQRTVGEYRRVLDDFLIGPRHQLTAGYAFVLRSYDVSQVDSETLKGHIYVDVALNQSWWNTYYQLVGALDPQGRAAINEGPITVIDNAARADLMASHRVDKSLQYDLVHPLPVKLKVGSKDAQFILYKNALLISAQPMTADTAKTSHQFAQAERGEISMTQGNVAPGTAKIDREKSALSCGSVIQSKSAVYCGDRFTIKIPFEARNESEVIDMMNQGVKAELNLFGSACESDCSPEREEGELDQFKMLLDGLR